MNENPVPIVAILMPVILVPTILILVLMMKKREYAHKERMKAIEMGMDVPADDSWPGRLCMGIGLGVPTAAFLFTWLASQSWHMPGEIYIAPGVVSVVAVLVSRNLAMNLMAPSRRPRDEPRYEAKPAFDPDAYDVVGRRG